MIMKKRGNTVKFVCRSLITDMEEGNFISGDKLTAESLAERYQVSRTPIREALNILTCDGLLEATPNAGFSVPVLTPEDLCEIYKIREVLEGLAVYELVSNGVPAGLTDKLRQYYEARKNARNANESIRYDLLFHQLLCDECGSKQLQQLIKNYLVLSRIFHSADCVYVSALKQCGRPLKPRDIHREHAEIIQAIEDGDAKLARKKVSEHIAQARKALEKVSKLVENKKQKCSPEK
ncbi:MAG: GntR family transcriptional regulator [Lentisphaeria bacterium]|nr:GntR family transcriptional regulator [Lentisphaeria bacterium]